jgi:membrane-associated protease RseP (regulator of RpoE activity)
MGAEESKASSSVEYDANHPTSPGSEGPVHLALAPQEGRPPKDSVAWIPAPVALPEPGIAAPPATKSAAPATKKVAGSTKPPPAGVFGDAKDYNPVLPNTISKDDKSMQPLYVTKDIKITKRPKMDFRIAIYDSGLIANVGPDGLAREAGLEVGDTLLAVDGVGIKSAKQLYDILGKVVDSSLVTFKVKRSQPVQEPGIQEIMISKRPGKGFRIAIYDSGLIANVGPDGLAGEAGLKIDDTLLSFNGVGIKSAKQLYDILGKVVDSSLVTFKVKRSPDHKGKKMKFTLY